MTPERLAERIQWHRATEHGGVVEPACFVCDLFTALREAQTAQVANNPAKMAGSVTRSIDAWHQWCWTQEHIQTALRQEMTTIVAERDALQRRVELLENTLNDIPCAGPASCEAPALQRRVEGLDDTLRKIARMAEEARCQDAEAALHGEEAG